jgi:ribonuclease D
MNPTTHWISTTGQLEALVDGLGTGPLALDTEADSLHHYPERVCLVQLQAGGESYLIDPLASVDLAPLARPLADRSILKLLHGADYDLRGLHRDFGLEIRGLFDTMIAARLVGKTSFGLAALLRDHFGLCLDKKYQRADWSRRPLPAAMVRYAALDTLYLEPLAAKLREGLQGLDRIAWAEEEFRRLEDVRWRDEPDPEAYRRIKGASTLGRRGLAALRELATRREAEARKRGRPPFKVLSNDVLVRLARRLPSNADDLAEIEGFPSAWRTGHLSRLVLDAARVAKDLPDEDLPHQRSRKRPSRSPGHEARLRGLCKARDVVAASLGLEPSVLAAKSVLEQALLAREHGEPPESVPGLRRWQADLLRPAFDQIPG